MRSGGIQTVVCDAWRSGSPIASDLPVVAGSVTDDSAPGVRRTLDIELSPKLGLYELLAPIGTELRPRSVWRYPSGVTESVPMGVFDIESQSVSYSPDGNIKCHGVDKWARIQRARFLKPEPSLFTLSVVDQIVALIRGALGASEPVVVTATSTAITRSAVWERDRDETILELAKSIGARVSFDRAGVATVEDLPTIGGPAVWTVDASETGVMLSGSRDRDRKRTYNVVVVTGEAADGVAPFDPRYVWDNDPSSPTFAATGIGFGTTPPVAGTGGPFGIVPYFYSSPLVRDGTQAISAGQKILARTAGMAAQLRLEAVRNHALDSLDVIDALLPPERFDQEQPLERHVIDRITHPLTPRGVQVIETRSTRTDEYT